MAIPMLICWQVYDGNGRRKYVNSSERARFLAYADRAGAEIQALCYLLAFSGCRISEALALTPQQLDAERGLVLFRTLKRRRLLYRPVPLPAPVLAMLLAIAPDDGRLWAIHRSTAWRHITRIMGQVGIVGPMASPKGLRHGFGIRAAGCSVPTNLIQRWMGHASPVTTAVYLDAVGLEERAFAERMW